MSNTPTTTHYDVHDEFGNTIGRDTVVTFSPRRPRGWTQWRPGTLMDERTRRIAVEAELAALKARRCDGCVHWTPSPAAINGYAFCLLPNLQHDSPMAVELGREVPQMRADHACNAWTARA